MKIKKILALVLAILILGSIGIFSLTSLAVANATLTVGTAQGNVGNEVTIPISISANTGVAAAKLIVDFDKDKLEIVENGVDPNNNIIYKAVQGGTVSGSSDINVQNIIGKVTMAYANTSGFYGSGEFLVLTFKIKQGAAGNIPVTLTVPEFYTSTYAEIPTQVTNGSVTAKVPLTGISLDKATLALSKGNTGALEVIYNPANTTDDKTATWSTSNSAVATVSNGTVTAVGAGNATITANVGGKTATCAVKVNIPLTGISINEATLALKKGQTGTLAITFTPSDTTDSKTVTWSTSDATVATVANGVVTAKKAGDATITATVGTFSKTCAVTVTEIPLNSIALSKSTATILKSRTDTLTVVVNPADTTDDLGTATWQTSDATIATVTNGVVTGVKAGTATITGTLNGKTATCEVKVTEPVITIGQYSTAPTNQNITVTATAINGTLNESSHTFTANGSFEFVATDAAGNTDKKTVAITNIDKTAPVITVKDDDNKLIANNGAVPLGKKITISTDDGQVVIKKDATAFTVPEDGKIAAEGVYVVTATDALGNASKATFSIVKMATAGEKTDSSTSIKIEYQDNIVPENVQLVVAPIATNQITNANFVLKADEKISGAFEITLKSNGVEIQPNGKIKVSLPIPAGDLGKELRIMHIKDDGTVEVIVATIVNGFAVFETSSFSKYVIVARTPVTKPVTSDAISMFLIMFSTSIIGIGIVLIKRKIRI